MAERQLMGNRPSAKYLDVAEQTLANWRYLGTGPRYFRVGKQLVKYDRADLDRWLEERATEPSPAA
jgi:predicted DNA-binding transcriptional regulator AlpA